MKKRLEQEATTLCHQKSRVKQRHPDQVALNLSNESAQKDAFGILEDDGNEAWEDVDADEEGFTEQDRIRQEEYDAIKNLETLDFEDCKTVAKRSEEFMNSQLQTHVKLAFQEVKRHSVAIAESLFTKLHEFAHNPLNYAARLIEWLKVEYPDDWETVSITGFKIFTPAEIMVWKYLGIAAKIPKMTPRNGAKRYLPRNAKIQEMASVWETLPGPAIIWKMDDAEIERLEKIFNSCDTSTKKSAAKSIKGWVLGRVGKTPTNFHTVFDDFMGN
ncbi:hypothetical protein ACHAQJ_010403 [Trichoderma viride]